MVTPSSDTAAPSYMTEQQEHEAPRTLELQAVLWDMDGTIVDTEPYWIEAEYQLVTAHGGSWSDEQAEGLVGQALTFSAGVLQSAGVKLSVREIIDTLTEQVTSKVREAVPWRPGARELLLALRDRDIPCALVTMSEKQLAVEVARHLPEGTFDLLVTGDRVAKGKPDPEAYQTAFDELAASTGLTSKDRVVAIEDSLPGVTSAKAAGVVTVGVPHFVALPSDSADYLWSTLEGRGVADLEGLLQSRPGAAAGDGPVT
jgi:HAD superfamily hydrolase (TIGR01509 family)